MEKWPNFFIVGAPKAGTTSLYEYLKKIPGIYMSKIKEPHYFSKVPPGSFMIGNKKDYLELFKDAKDEKAIGEASTSYLACQETPKLIHSTIPNAKIIIILRDPVEQFFSGHLMLHRQGIQKISFHERIEKEFKKNYEQNLSWQTNGYSEQVKRYFEIFGRDQVKIIIFEEFIQNKKRIVEDVLSFLDVNHTLENFEGKTYNKFEDQRVPRGKISEHLLRSGVASKIAKGIKIMPLSSRIYLGEKILKKKQPIVKPIIQPEDKEILVKFFQDDVKKLKNCLECDLPWSNFKN